MTTKTMGEVSLGMLDGHSPTAYVFWGFCDPTCLDYMWYTSENLLQLREKKTTDVSSSPCEASINKIAKAKQLNGIKYRTRTNKL